MREHINTTSMTGTFLRSDLDRLGLNPRTRDTLELLPTSRDTIVEAVDNLTDDVNEIEAEPFLTWDTATALMTACRLLLGTAANISLTISATDATLDLISTAVTPGTYGDNKHLAQFVVDKKGRITSAQQFVINTDNIVEGVLNLFFTQARARASLSGAGQVNYNSTTGVIDTTGFTGTGTYTTFTFVNGICTAAS